MDWVGVLAILERSSFEGNNFNALKKGKPNSIIEKLFDKLRDLSLMISPVILLMNIISPLYLMNNKQKILLQTFTPHSFH